MSEELIIRIKSVEGGYRAHFAGRRGPEEACKSMAEAIGELVWRQSYQFCGSIDELVFEIVTKDEIERHDRYGATVRPNKTMKQGVV